MKRRVLIGAGCLFGFLMVLACVRGVAVVRAGDFGPGGRLEAVPGRMIAETKTAAPDEGPAGAPAAARNTGPIKIGGVFDITGPTSALCTDYALGASDAVEYINNSEGIQGASLRLVALDYASEIPKAIEVYKRLRHVEKVYAVLGWGACDTWALSPVIKKDEVVFMTTDLDPRLSDPRQNPYTFGVGASYTDQIRMAVRYAAENGGKKICFIFPDHPFGLLPIPAGKEYAQKMGLSVGPDVMVGLRATDATPQLMRMKSFDPDFAWVGGTTPGAGLILKNASDMGLRTKFLINAWGFDENLPQVTGSAAEGRAFGLMVVRPYGHETSTKAGIRNMTGERTHTLQYNKGWVSIMVLAEGLRRSIDRNGPSLKAALETLKDFQTGGLTPPLTYTPTDHRPTTSCGLFTVKDGRLSFVADIDVERRDDLLGR